jgi:Ca2+-transporting ATPase
VVANLALIFVNRSWSRTFLQSVRAPNKALWWVMGGGLVLLLLVLEVPALRELFRFAPLHADDLALTIGAGLASVSWFEVVKAIDLWRRRGKPALATL